MPVVRDEWVLADGTRLDPFKVTRVGDYLYGRGTIDDKGSIASVLYAMRDVKASGLPLVRTIRLMIETTEESGGDGMKYYQGKVKVPDYNILLDSKYPAVVAEKGTGRLGVLFPAQPVALDTGVITVITAMAAAASASTISQTATATLQGGDVAQAAEVLRAARAGFIQKYERQGGSFSIDVTPDAANRRIEVKLTGVSAHGSRPEEGATRCPA